MLSVIQDVSVLEQEKVDKLMLDMDGTENKCKMLLYYNLMIGAGFCEIKLIKFCPLLIYAILSTKN